MSRCPHCRKSFRELDDEQGQHDCPHCGYSDAENEAGCSWCGLPFEFDAVDFPYCSPECAIAAERDSEDVERNEDF